MKPLIYVIEDDLDMVARLKSVFVDFRVESPTDFLNIDQQVDQLKPDLILMDLGLPYFNGLYWTSQIRKKHEMPILFISSAIEDRNAIMALDMGADDFIAKPFSTHVLLAKVRAMLRRSQVLSSNQLVYKQYVLSLSEQKINDISLSPTEVKLLHALFRQQGQLLTKDALLDTLWEGGDFIDENALHVAMARLRKKVAPLKLKIITVRGVGYCLP